MSTLETNLIQPSTGTTLTVGASGDTVALGTGVLSSGLAFDTLSETTASSSASVAFSLSASYKHFMILMENVIPASDQQHFFLTVSTDSGSSYASASYNFTVKGFEDDDGEDFYGANGQSSIQLTRYQSGSDTGEFGVSGVMYLGGVRTNTAVNKAGVFMSANETYTGKLNGNYVSFQYAGATSAWTNIKFAFASGNIESGSFKLLGSK